MGFIESFIFNFIEKDCWKYIVEGLGVTVTVAFFAVLLGVLIGFLVAYVRTTHDRTGRMKVLNVVAKVYLTVIRGTPVLIQLLIMYFVIFGSINVPKIVAASLAFGLNSGAYVAEIFRSGIMSIDNGQMEAGRSLGLNYNKTMWLIIMPQAIKNILPALANEFIVLLKETSVSGFIALNDLTKGADIIRSQTWQALFPLLGAAAIYLVMVMVLQHFVNKLERKLAKSDNR